MKPAFWAVQIDSNAVTVGAEYRKEEDTEPAMEAVTDRGESVDQMEPLLVGERSPKRSPLTDQVVELVTRATRFRSRLPPGVEPALAGLVRSMNCYYSNLIEGHNTHPVAIERALAGEYSPDSRQRDLQLEAKAHITVQHWIDDRGLEGRATSPEGLIELHKRFCEQLPEELLWVNEPETDRCLRVVPGGFREDDVQVGRHVPISPGAIGRFLQRFDTVYSASGQTDRLLGAACAHHRLLWIHPFLDGNGRVARLMSHAVLVEHLDSGGIWSVARGLARNEGEYKQRLAACDDPRRGDRDGRGQLSESALAEFAGFFLGICIDQIDFMERLMEPDQFRDRLLRWAEELVRSDELPPQSGRLLEAVLYRSEVPRGDVPSLLDLSERQARRVTSALLGQGILTSPTSRSPLRLALPAALAPRLMPGLFPPEP